MSSSASDVPNGAGAAALLAAGIGALALAVLAIAGDHSAAFEQLMSFYRPTGPLSGVTTSAIAVWLIAWGALDRRWRTRTVAIGKVAAAALILLGLALVLTFPPLSDVL